MKVRLVGSITVLVILAVLFVVTSVETPQSTVQPSKAPSDNSFKDLKIN